MTTEIYEKSEFDNLNGAQIQQLGNKVYQRFIQKRNYFNNVRNSQMLGPYEWNQLQVEMAEFENAYNNWNRTWGSISRQQNADSFIKYFEQIRPKFSRMDEFIESLRPKYEHSDSVEDLKKEILLKVDEDLANLTNNIELQISNGIQDLIDLKAEYKLQDTFANSIKNEKNRPKKLG